MSVHRLIALLIGLAMALAPLGMPASAAAPAGGHHMMAAIGQSVDHCAGHQLPDKQHKSMDEGCCVATCVGVATVPVLPAEPLSYAGLALRPAADLFRNGVPLELPTPPPRLA